MWTRDSRSYAVIRHAWLSMSHFRPLNKFLYRLKGTKRALFEWNKTQFGKIQYEIASTRAVLAIGDRDKDLRCHLEELLKREEMLWFQISRVQWALEGDRCTKFFFISTLIQRKNNRIERLLLDNGMWISSREDIGSAFL
ncbi:hypothetical protein UlMin_021460 [Ulmus minor]